MMKYLPLLLALICLPAQAYPARAWLSAFPLWQPPAASQRIEEERAYLMAHKPYLEARLSAVQPLIRLIAKAVDDHKLPSMLILLPFIESGYRLDVVSSAGAAGLWQLMPDTARRFGVPSLPEFDGRYSLPVATEAALAYLGWLHKRFDGDWLLALAAYNAGEGRVQRAMAESGEYSYWRLPLPEETRRYVPRLMALAELLQHPTRFGLTLPDWKSGVELTIQRFSAPLSLSTLAKVTKHKESQLAALNPAFRQGELSARGDYLLLLPIGGDSSKSRESKEQGLALTAIPPILPLERQEDPLLLSHSRGLDLQIRQHMLVTPANATSDPLGLSLTRPLLQTPP